MTIGGFRLKQIRRCCYLIGYRYRQSSTTIVWWQISHIDCISRVVILVVLKFCYVGWEFLYAAWFWPLALGHPCIVNYCFGAVISNETSVVEFNLSKRQFNDIQNQRICPYWVGIIGIYRYVAVGFVQVLVFQVVIVCCKKLIITFEKSSHKCAEIILYIMSSPNI